MERQKRTLGVVSISVIKHRPKATWLGKALLQPKPLKPQKFKQGRNLGAETEVEAMEEPEYWLAQSAFIAPQRWHWPQRAGPSHINQDNAHRTILWGIFPVEVSP